MRTLHLAAFVALASAALGCGSSDGSASADLGGDAGALDAASGSDADAPDSSDAPTEAEAAAPDLGCNGAIELCDRRLDEVALAGAHNAMSNVDEGWHFANQQHGMVRQLDDGIRAMLIDVHPGDAATPEVPAGDPVLCHGLCAIGHLSLVEGFTRIRTWLDAHPREVLVFVIEDYVPAERITPALETSGLLPSCLHRDLGQAFPTLGEMIASNQRVFIMLESGAAAPSWAHGYQDFAQDNPYSAETAADLACTRLRGKAGNPLLLVNHFLTRGSTAHDVLAEEVNHDPVLSTHVHDCQTAFGKLPNIVALDWYHVGDLMPLVRSLNGLPAAP